MSEPILQVSCCCEKKHTFSVRITYTEEEFQKAYNNEENLVDQQVRCIYCHQYCRFKLPANCFKATSILKNAETPKDFPEGFLQKQTFPTEPSQE